MERILAGILLAVLMAVFIIGLAGVSSIVPFSVMWFGCKNNVILVTAWIAAAVVLVWTVIAVHKHVEKADRSLILSRLGKSIPPNTKSRVEVLMCYELLLPSHWEGEKLIRDSWGKLELAIYTKVIEAGLHRFLIIGFTMEDGRPENQMHLFFRLREGELKKDPLLDLPHEIYLGKDGSFYLGPDKR